MQIVALLLAAFAASAVAKVEKDCVTENATMCSQHRHHVMMCYNGKWVDTDDCHDRGMHCDMIVVKDQATTGNPTTALHNFQPTVAVAKCVAKQDD